MPTVTLMPPAVLRFYDADGLPLALGKVYTYLAGTSTPVTTYSNAAGTIANANPIILDAAGRCTIYIPAQSIKIVVKTADDVEVAEENLDGISSPALTLVGGDLVGTDDEQTLSNKELDNTNSITVLDGSLVIQNTADETKEASFSLSGITAGQNRVMSVPDANIQLGEYVISRTILTPAEMIDQNLFIADQAYQLTAVKCTFATAEATAANLRLQVTKDTSTNAPGAGTNLLTNNSDNGFDCKATANTVQTGTLTSTVASLQLAAGDRIALDFEAAATELAGLTVSLTLKRI